MKLVSFNVHNGFEDYENAFDDALSWLKLVQPDIVCFQEMTWRFFSLGDFQRKVYSTLGFKHFSYGSTSNIYGNGFYGQVTCSRIQISAVFNLYLPRNPGKSERRSCLIVKLANGLTIANTHLDPKQTAEELRLSQIQAIDRHLGKWDLFPALLCGDFNAVRKQEAPPGVSTKALSWLQTRRGGVKDAMDLVGKRATRSHRKFPVRLDFCFVLDQHKQLVVSDASVPYVEFSDHLPIIVTFDVKR